MNGEVFYDEIADKTIKRGIGLEDILKDDVRFFNHIVDVFENKNGKRYQVDNYEWTFSIIPDSVIKKLSSFQKALMVLITAWGMVRRRTG